MEDEMQGKEVDTVRVSKGASINGSNANDLHLVALVDDNYASLILNNWSTTIRNGDTKKGRQGWNWWNLSVAKHKRITIVADMQSIIIITIDRVSYHLKKYFDLMI